MPRKGGVLMGKDALCSKMAGSAAPDGAVFMVLTRMFFKRVAANISECVASKEKQS